MAARGNSLPSIEHTVHEYAVLPWIDCPSAMPGMQFCCFTLARAIGSMQIHHGQRAKSLILLVILKWNIQNVFCDPETNWKRSPAMTMGVGRCWLSILMRFNSKTGRFALFKADFLTIARRGSQTIMADAHTFSRYA